MKMLWVIMLLFFTGETQAERKCLLEQWRPMKMKLSKRQIFVSTRVGSPMIVDGLDSFVSSQIQATGSWQPNIANLILHLVKQGDKAANIGSQTGMEALGIAKIIGKTGKLYVFEPYSVSYMIMRKNMFLNGFGDILTTYKIAASNKFQIGQLSIPYSNTGMSKVGRTQDFSNQELNKQTKQLQNRAQEQTLIARADQVLPQDLLLDFILIDVESMEIEAIDGLRKVIDRSPNLIILSQWQYGLFSRTKSFQLFETVVLYLFSKGYKIYQIIQNRNQNGVCEMPKLIEKTDVKSLIIAADANVLMMPPTRNLPNY